MQNYFKWKFIFQYFVSYKLSEEYTGITSMYVTSFLAYIGFAAQVPNILFNWLNVFVQIGYVFQCMLLILDNVLIIRDCVNN